MTRACHEQVIWKIKRCVKTETYYINYFSFFCPSCPTIGQLIQTTNKIDMEGKYKTDFNKL